jgi:peptidoglycan hydrolase FlgJ
MTAPVDASVYANLSGLAALKREAHAADPQALREVARQFESIFAKMMLTSMRQASFGDPLFGSDQTQFYQGMFDDQLSLELTKGRGLGLADLLVRQLQGPGAAGAQNAELKAPARGSDSAQSHDPTPSAAAKMAPTGAISSEPDAVYASDALSVATRFVEKMLSGNAAADAASSGARPSVRVPLVTSANAFRTPSSPEEFVQQLWPCAEEAGRELGVNPAHLLAQAALETGWGKSLPCDANGNPSFNFFGIKAGTSWQGESVNVRTLEFEGGLPTPKQARFRAYESAADSFRDYVALLRDSPRYAAALNTGNDAQAFATALQHAGYATDPGYARKIVAIAQNLASSAPTLKSGAAQPIPSAPGAL